MERNIQYNTEKAPLVLPEYGRGIQSLIDYCLTIQDKEERQSCAENIVRIMSTILQEKFSLADTQRKLWNHLAQMSRWQLDVEYPVEIDMPEDFQRPERIPYPTRNIRKREFGSLMEQTIAYVNTLPRGEEREVLSAQVDMLVERIMNDKQATVTSVQTKRKKKK